MHSPNSQETVRSLDSLAATVAATPSLEHLLQSHELLVKTILEMNQYGRLLRPYRFLSLQTIFGWSVSVSTWSETLFGMRNFVTAKHIRLFSLMMNRYVI